jgi:hypothetical protein
MQAACEAVHGDKSLLRRACEKPETRTAYGYKWKWAD